MPRLTAAKIKTIKKPGMHGDGNGLYLRVTGSGSRSWMQRIVIAGRRRDLGLGGYPATGLAEARALALANKALVTAGRDPVAERHRENVPTFRDAAKKVYEANLPRWRNGKHTVNWWGSLERHAFPVIGDVRVDRIRRGDVLAVLEPIWGVRPETARRVRQRIRTILRWCEAHDYCTGNAAGEALNGALPPMPRLKAHHRALPYQEVTEALATVDASDASLSAKLCLRFLILTAARSGEARGATWDEIDETAREWRIPAERMKGGVQHRVPLSDAALTVLKKADQIGDGSGLVFPSSAKRGQPMSDMTLTKVLRSTRLAERATVHGFRSTFRDWAAECTNAPHAVMELSLAHAVGSSVEQAYARSDLIAKRRALMDQWAGFVTGQETNAMAVHVRRTGQFSTLNNSLGAVAVGAGISVSVAQHRSPSPPLYSLFILLIYLFCSIGDMMARSGSGSASSGASVAAGRRLAMSKWYVVHTRPHQEQRAEVNLARQGYRAWLPVMERSRRRAKRFESGYAPLFPQYLFVELDIGREPWRAINGTFGVKRLLADGPRPRALPEEFVAALWEATGADGVSSPEPPDLKPGDAVTIAIGPFVECAAVVLRLAPRERVEVLLNVLGGRVPARLPKRAVIAAA